MGNAKYETVEDAAKLFQEDLSTIISFPVPWEEITVSITAMSYVEGATLEKRLVWSKKLGIYRK